MAKKEILSRCRLINRWMYEGLVLRGWKGPPEWIRTFERCRWRGWKGGKRGWLTFLALSDIWPKHFDFDCKILHRNSACQKCSETLSKKKFTEKDNYFQKQKHRKESIWSILPFTFNFALIIPSKITILLRVFFYSKFR